MSGTGAILAAPTRVSETETPTSAMSLSGYVLSYWQQANRLRIRAMNVDLEEVEVRSRRDRATRELSVTPEVGPRVYHKTNPSDADPLFQVGVNAEYSYRGNDGIGYTVRGNSFVPNTSEGLARLAGTIQYGVDGTFSLPMLRNRGGREFGYEAEVAEARVQVAAAEARQEILLACADAVQRYVLLYARDAQKSAYEALLREKQRQWYQTIRDYKNQMITRLDMLSARSDWIFAKSLRPGFDARYERALAAFRAYAPNGPFIVSDPGGLIAKAPVETLPLKLEVHPRYVALTEQVQGFEQEILLAREQNRSELDFQVTAGVSRVHDIFVPPTGFAEVTDMRALVGVRYLLPIERPEIRYRIQALRLQKARVAEQKMALERELRQSLAENLASWRRETEAYALRGEQLAILKWQIAAAYKEFRAGKLQFQDYLDHWDRFQQARLDIWDRWIEARLAELNLIPVTGMLPEYCREKVD